MRPKKLSGFLNYDDGDKVFLSMRVTSDGSSIFFEAESIETSVDDAGLKVRWHTEGKLRHNFDGSYQSIERHHWRTKGSRGGPEGYLTIEEIDLTSSGSTRQIWGAFTEFDLEDYTQARYAFSGTLNVIEEFALRQSPGSKKTETDEETGDLEFAEATSLKLSVRERPRSELNHDSHNKGKSDDPAKLVVDAPEKSNLASSDKLKDARPLKFSYDVGRRWMSKNKAQLTKWLIFGLRLGFVAFVYLLLVKGCNALFN